MESNVNDFRELIDVKEYVKGLEDLIEATRRTLSRIFAELDFTKTDATLSEELRDQKAEYLEKQIRAHAAKIAEIRNKLSSIIGSN